MSTLNVKITSKRPDNYLVNLFQAAKDKHTLINALTTYLTGISSGSESAESSSSPLSVSLTVQGSSQKASGTFTLNTVIATDAVTINGVTFTAVASGATGNQFNVGISDTATAANLAASINASNSSLVSDYVSASSSGAVVTVTSDFFGPAGNMTEIASLDSTIVASGARLSGGSDDASKKTLTF